jgi:hypothetical protein
LEPLPAERTSQARLPFSSFFTASAQVILVPGATVSMKDDATRSTYACPRPSRNWRSSVQLP